MFSLWRHANRHNGVLNNMPLVDTLHRAVSLQGIEDALQANVIDAVAVTASSYSTGVHWTFRHTRDNRTPKAWNRPGRRAEFQPLTDRTLMASSALPFIFPATPLWVDGRREYFGDGSMRQLSPLSSAMQLGAHRILVVGVGQPQRSGFAENRAKAWRGSRPWAASRGHAMASVFHDTLQADVEQAQRVTRTLRQLPREVAAVLPYRGVEVLAMHPSQSLDALAQVRDSELPVTCCARSANWAPSRAAARWRATCCSSPGSCRRWSNSASTMRMRAGKNCWHFSARPRHNRRVATSESAPWKPARVGSFRTPVTRCSKRHLSHNTERPLRE